MDPKLKQDLDALLQQRSAAERAALESAELQMSKDAANLDAFYEVRGEAIAPAMREFGEYLAGHGLAYRVTPEDKSPNPREGVVVASIEFKFGPADRFNAINAHSLPGIRLAFNERARSVSIYESAMWPDKGGSAGATGDAPLEQVTAEFVQQRLAALVKKVLKGPSSN